MEQSLQLGGKIEICSAKGTKIDMSFIPLEVSSQFFAHFTVPISLNLALW